MRTVSILTTAALLCATPCFAIRTHHTAGHATIRHASSRSHRSVHALFRHEAPSMDPERATEIQQALIKSGYLTGEPSGVWDAQSAAAMEKLQADNGWQTKITPDSRALIKLGLGPQQDTIASSTTSTTAMLQ
ncbi:MAG TPA: peptidoglycan-binding domain-containing protein [Candidatus Aquilonibacter sp.]|nr:peptidoglycan-binding domain-containing protein [Candidatus Aquilonibacter sp.]